MNSKGRSINSIRNIIWGISNKIIILVLTFVGRKLFLHILGVDYLGINSLFTDILNMLNLADLGFGIAMSYSFYKPLATNDKKKIAALVQFFGKVYKIIALGVAIVGVALIPFLPMIVNLEKDIPHLTIYYLLYLSNTVASYICIYKSSIINADQKNYIVTTFEMCSTLIRVVLQIGILYITHNYVLYIAVNIVATVANNLFISKKATQLYPYIEEKAELTKDEKKSIYDNVKSVFIYKISNMMLNSIDSILISSIVSTTIVGFYSNYAVVTNYCLFFVNICFTSVTASIGNLFVTENGEKKYKVFSSMNMVNYYLCAICMAGFYAVLNDFVIMWLGEAYTLPQLAFIAILAANYSDCSFKSTVAFREATGIYRKIKYVVMLAAMLNIGVSVLLGKTFGLGLAGILFATVIVRMATYMWYEPMVLIKEFFGEKPVKYFVNRAINLICTLVGVGLTYAVINIIGFSKISWLNIIVKAIISVIIVSVVYFIRYCRTEEFKYMYAKFGNMLKNKKA